MSRFPLPARPWKALLMGLAAPTIALSAPGVATAAWSTSGPGQTTGAAYTMPTGTQPSGLFVRGLVILSWAPVTLGGGQAVQGYEISRVNASTGGPGTVGGTCSGIVTTTSCADPSVPAGSWTYTVTPVQLTWSGATSPASAAIVVP